MPACSSRFRREDGFALATGLVVVFLMMSLGFVALGIADIQARQSGAERVDESAFNLSEGVLSSQVFILSRLWPGIDGGAWDCTQASAGVPRCPDPSKVSDSFATADYAANTTWSTIVRDNGGSQGQLFYDDTVIPGQPSWDANADDRMWVRARGIVRGKQRTLVALVKVEKLLESFPRNVITAGKFEVLPTGRQVYIETGDSFVQVRCDIPLTGPTASDPCAGYEPSKDQVQPNNVADNYAAGNALDDAALERFKTRAQASGTYCGPEGTLNTAFCDSDMCPKASSLNRPGQVIYAAPGGTVTCDYANNAKPCCNGSSPEILIFENGKLDINADITFYGIIYMANKTGLTDDDVLRLRGGVTVRGAVAVDGGGGVSAGSNGLNLIYEPNVFNALISFGSAGIIRNTWREVPG